jgi:hypothetical protein
MSKENTMPIIKAVDEEQKVSVEIVYVPYELDKHNQWMRPETIRDACDNFNVNLEKGAVKPNLYHCKDEEGKVTETEAFEIVKTWVNEVECQIGDQIVPEGAWIAKLQWKDDKYYR